MRYNSKTGSIAIVGMACRVGSDVVTPEQLWTALREGRELVQPVPPHRRASVGRKLGPCRGGWLSSVDQFDAAFFGISPREAACIDPQQRLMLELGWEALEHAGISAQSKASSDTGVFVGIASHDYEYFVTSGPSPTGHGFSGASVGFAAGRLSYALGFHGPSMSIDTGCSSSLVALHHACESLAVGDCNLALVGGVNVILAPYSTAALGQLGALSPEGRCKTLDSRADGFARAEGAIMLAVKRLEDAVQDCDRIWAVVRGTYVNHDGRSPQLTVPNGDAQRALVERALERAQLRPDDIDYVEMHGTGTPVGDPIEFEALREVFGRRSVDSPCVLGAVKTNIGHLEAAAGAAGVMKAAMSLRHEEIPANLNFLKPNPKLRLEGTPFLIPTRNVPWPRSSRRRYAGISAFGISGTNAHVILEEAPEPKPRGRQPAPATFSLPISAQSSTALAKLAAAWASRVTDADGDTVLADLCRVASVRRTHLRQRAVVLGSDRGELLRGVQALANNERTPRVITGEQIPTRAPKIAFVFPGHGSQWVGMGRKLLKSEPAFCESLRECDAAMHEFTGWSVIDMLLDDSSRLADGENAVVQPVLVAMEIALAKLWKAWGIQADAVVGHSMGEVAAAHIAGALTLKDAARVICMRSQVLRRVIGQGSMVLVELGMDDARRAIAGLEHAVSIAVNNSANTVVLSGDTRALQKLVDELQSRQVFCRFVRVDYASHSPQMDPLHDELAEVLSPVRAAKGTIPMYSTLWAERTDGAKCNADYWIRNLREPVLFAGAVERLIADGHTYFLEVSPHPLLTTSIEQLLGDTQGVAVGSLRRDQDDRDCLMESMARLHVSGCPVDFSCGRNGPTPVLDVPTYPWERQRFWTEADQQQHVHVPTATATAGAEGEPAIGYAMAGAEISLAGESVHRYWELDIGLTSFPFLTGHRVLGACVVPAAAYLELAVAHGRAVFGTRLQGLRAVRFSKVATLTEDEGIRVQVRITQPGGHDVPFQIVSRRRNASEWTLHCTGTFILDAKSELASVTPLDVLRQSCTESVSIDRFYDELSAIGLQYGPEFRVVRELYRGPDGAIARISLSDVLQAQHTSFHLHPAKLDGCLQVLAALFLIDDEGSERQTLLPVGVRDYRLSDRNEGDFWVHARMGTSGKPGSAPHGDVLMFDAEGRIVGRVTGLTAQRLEDPSLASNRQWLHAFEWLAAEPPSLPEREERKWLVLADRSGVGLRLGKRLEELGAQVVLAQRAAPSPRGTRAKNGYEYTLQADDADALASLLRAEFSNSACSGIVHLWSLDCPLTDATSAEEVEEFHDATCGSIVRLVQAIASVGLRDAPSLRVVTRGAQLLDEDPAPSTLGISALWGACRTLNAELPELHCACIDLPPQPYEQEVQALAAEIVAGTDDQVALRESARYTGRISVREQLHERDRQLPYDGSPYAVELETAGTLASLRLRGSARSELAAGEIEIEVQAAGINFVDVMRAMGIYPDPEGTKASMGWECAGRVSAVAPDVVSPRVGDLVVALANPAFGSHITTRAAWSMPIPEWLSVAQAACLPIAYSTAWISLQDLARLRAGERVLIHSASGGTGLAAVDIAQRIGAEIFATAGRPEKREYLRSLGIQHVMDSRSLAFADEIMEVTHGTGVDVVLNSLTGDAIDSSLSVLAMDGRFIEIGKSDIYADRPLAAKWFKKRIGYYAVDLAGLGNQRTERAATLFRTVINEFAAKRLSPLPVKMYPASEAGEAMRELAQGCNIGKVALSFTEPPREIYAGATVTRYRHDAAYLITGGCGAMGSSLARWLAERGVKHLWLAGRSAANEGSAKLIDALKTLGVTAHYAQADVSKLQDVEELLQTIDRSGQPLRGVFHLAGILEDRIVGNVDPASLRRVFAPKLLGAWNLHRATLGRALDCFVLYSSMAGLVGSPGQYAYNAANAAVDGLARYRRARGERATSICWGPIASVGLAAENERRRESIAWRGLNAISLDRANEKLGEILAANTTHIAVADWDYRQFFEAMPIMTRVPSFSLLRERAARSSRSSGKRLLNELQNLPQVERVPYLENHLRDEFALVLRADAARIERTTPIESLGLDSLMGLEIRNRIEIATGLKLAAAVLWTYTNIASLAGFLLREMFPEESAARADAAVESEESLFALETNDTSAMSQIARELDNLSDVLSARQDEA